MILALTGMMGSGKTTVGRLVADALGCPFMDMDELVARKAGKGIAAFFATDGEAAFRLLEGKVLKETVKKYAQSTAVLALGGGTVTAPGALSLLRDHTLCIWLQVSEAEALTRIGDTGDHPLARLAGAQDRPLAGDWAALLEARTPLYAAAAQVTLDTDGAAPETLADEIIISVL